MIAPTRRTERLEILDVLRGFAILGILLVNVHFYSRPLFAVFRDLDSGSTAVDRFVVAATTVLVSEKFFSILSVLFGAGAAILFDRVSAAVYFRRLAGLLAIGAVHALTLYSGDFLGNYAVLGVFLWPLRRARSAHLLTAGAVILLVPCLMMVPALTARATPHDGGVASSPEADEARQARRAALDQRVEESLRVYGEGTVAEMVRLRAREAAMQYSSLLFVGWKMFAMFLVGMAWWRSGAAPDADREAHLARLARRALLPLGIAGLAGSLLSLWVDDHAGEVGIGLRLAGLFGQQFGAPALALFYMSAIVTLWSHDAPRRWLAPLAPAGRMAMSLYVLQSVVCTTLCNSYGLGWFGRIGYGSAALLALAVGAAQIACSAWWFRRFEFGPLEWVLRRIAYARWR